MLASHALCVPSLISILASVDIKQNVYLPMLSLSFLCLPITISFHLSHPLTVFLYFSLSLHSLSPILCLPLSPLSLPLFFTPLLPFPLSLSPSPSISLSSHLSLSHCCVCVCAFVCVCVCACVCNNNNNEYLECLMCTGPKRAGVCVCVCNNNNEYLECLTCAGPKRARVRTRARVCVCVCVIIIMNT